TILGGDAEGLQVAYGAVILVSFLLCWLLQHFAAERIQDRIGIPGVLMVLPIAAIAASAVMLAGMATESLLLMAVGFGLWLIPRWSIDENARRAALALVPDERRTRVSFIVDLGPVAVGLIGAGLFSAVGLLTGLVWLIPVVSIVLAALAIAPSLRVVRGWDDSLLSWRMRRRKRGRSVDLGGS
ncbi:MAG: antiporter, family, partial [Actinomycetota bacterium]|nr:antiporter, family [Actinomycetota bacterium]